MKKLIYSLLAAAAFAAMASPDVFAAGISVTSVSSPRIRSFIMDDNNVDPATNDDMVFQGDFKFGEGSLPVSQNLAIVVAIRTGWTSTAITSGSLNGISSNPPYIAIGIYPNVVNDVGSNAPLRLDLFLGDGGARFHLDQGLAVAPDGSTSVNYDHNWHRLRFQATGDGNLARPGNLTVMIDNFTYINSTGNTSLFMPKLGRFVLGQSFNQGGPLSAAPQWDNIRTATSVANLVNAPVISDNLDQYDIGSNGNGNNGTRYLPGTGDGTTTPAYATEGGVANYGIATSTWGVRQEVESNYFNMGTAGASRGCFYLNSTGAGSYNISALDNTPNNTDNLGIRADILFPSALSAAEANSAGVTASMVLRQRGLVGGDDATNNSPGEAFSVGVDASGFLTFTFTHRTISNDPGTVTASTVTNIPYDHKWHQVVCTINSAGSTPQFEFPTMTFDGVAVIQGSNSALTGGTFQQIVASGSTLGYPLIAGAGYFGGGSNQGPVPSTPAITATVTPPGSGFVAQDEFCSIAQKMSVALSSNVKNIRWDNIYNTDATGAVDNARLGNISSYGMNSQTGTVANGTTLRNLADPWMNGTAATGGSNPTNWKIDTTQNSTIGAPVLNAVNDFFVY